MLELLVPAGSPEAVTAAVQNGADAVYISFDEMSACRQSVNFSDNAFEAAVRYCRVRRCRVYLALNSPLREDELPKAAGLALRGQRAGVDAVIVRDLGLFRILRRVMPDMPLFADYRLGFYTPESAQIAARLGFSRIFLPPEMPLEEVKRVSSQGIETAVFVLTSLCAAAAGQCRMSALALRESADRGLCSELCREDYTFGGRWDKKPLSWKDRNLLPKLGELEKLGVTCACIGNRERRAEFSAASAAACSQILHESQQPSAEELENLERAFVPYGLAQKDGFEPAAEKIESAPHAMEKYCAELRRRYSDSELRRVEVTFAVVARSADKPVTLGVQDQDKHQAVLEGPTPSSLGDVELSEEGLAESMYRTAGTPFKCDGVKVVASPGMKISGSELDVARRRLLYKLSEERARVPERRELSFPEEPFSAEHPLMPGVNFSFQTAEQMTAEMAALRPMCVYAPLELLAAHPELMVPYVAEDCEIVAVLPSVCSGEKEINDLRILLRSARDNGIAHAATGNLGLALLAGQENMLLRGDIDLCAFNAYTLQSLASAGFLSVALSPELTLEQIRALPKPVDTELVVYGRLPAMVTQTCLLKASAGRCTCTTPGQMADTHGGVWPVTKHFGCRNVVWGSRKLWLGDVTNEWMNAGLWAVRLNFSTESPRECLEVANSYIAGTGYRPNGMTRGLYYRGVL